MVFLRQPNGDTFRIIQARRDVEEKGPEYLCSVPRAIREHPMSPGGEGDKWVIQKIRETWPAGCGGSWPRPWESPKLFPSCTCNYIKGRPSGSRVTRLGEGRVCTGETPMPGLLPLSYFSTPSGAKVSSFAPCPPQWRRFRNRQRSMGTQPSCRQLGWPATGGVRCAAAPARSPFASSSNSSRRRPLFQQLLQWDDLQGDDS